ncbi:hypothetical protein [Mycobacterium sp. OTB74]|uniref:hypothetical protein n=1 Tax=Mycobacterium sp. OTB74 TaxID=1853452 RepID=UPI002476C1D0|nr:hypothetical protein [Mycobacterium sp. OTB74]
MTGQFTHVVGQLNTQINNQIKDTLPRLAEAARNAGPSTPLTTKSNSAAANAGSSPNSSSSSSNATGSVTQPSTTTSASANTSTATPSIPGIPLTPGAVEQAIVSQVPWAVASVPLTALDLVKVGLPLVTNAIPLPGLAALPLFADALIINPLEATVTGLASAASTLPFFSPNLPTTVTTVQMTNQNFPRTTALATSPNPPLAPSVDATRISNAPTPVATAKAPTPTPAPEHVFAADNHVVAQPEFRSGYPDYLRAAGIGEVAAVAVPGFAGIMTITAAGGLLGYRQARAGHAASPSNAARFMS